MDSEPPASAAEHSSCLRGCPICAECRCEPLHSQKFVLPDGHPLSDGYNVVSCAACGFVFADTQVTQSSYDEFYARLSKYADTQTSTGGGGSPEDALRLKEMAACISEWVPNRDAAILDIGCANGGLLKELHELGYNRLAGIDPALACIEATTKLCPAQGFVGSLSELPPALGEYDCVILSHVLEHVADLSAAVRAIHKLTRLGGLAYIEVPDAARYPECLIAPYQDFNTEHINHFSGCSLRNLFVMRGWSPRTIGHKTIWTGPRVPYPAVFGLFEKAGAVPESGVWEKDIELRARVVEYVRTSRAMMEAIDFQLQGVLAQENEVIVWGVGQLAMKLLAETCLGQARIAAFVDSNPINQGKVLREIPILSPSQLRASAKPIIVASLIQQHGIAKSIEQLGLPNKVVFLATASN